MSFMVCKIQNNLKITVVRKLLSRNQVYRELLAFIAAPNHVCTELIKLNGLDFQSQRLTIEEAPVKLKIT